MVTRKRLQIPPLPKRKENEIFFEFKRRYTSFILKLHVGIETLTMIAHNHDYNDEGLLQKKKRKGYTRIKSRRRLKDVLRQASNASHITALVNS